MEIFDFIDSKAISEHLKSINYQCSTIEKAFIVAMSTKATINEKHNAFKSIISNDKDEKIEKRPNTCEYPSLFAFLERYMQIENEIVNEFYNTKEAVFRFRYLCGEDRSFCEDFETVYPSFALCNDAFRKEIEKYEMMDEIRFYEFRMDSLTKIGKQIKLKYASNGELVDIDANFLSEDDSDVLSAFEGMWFDIPTPFKKGDILTYNRHYWINGDSSPVVLHHLSTWDGDRFLEINSSNTEKENARRRYLYDYRKNNGDISDMNICGYFGCEDGDFYWEVSHSILDYEYFDKPLIGGYRSLQAVSDYLKGELDIDSLTKITRYIMAEESLKDSRKYIHITDDYWDKIDV